MKKLRPFTALILFLSLALVILTSGCEKETQDVDPVNPILPTITTNPGADKTVPIGSDDSISWESQGISSITVKVDGEIVSTSISGFIPFSDIEKEIKVEFIGFDKNNKPIPPRMIRFMPQTIPLDKPTINLVSTPNRLSSPGSITITWTTSFANSVLHDGQSYPPSGNTSYSVTDTTTYEFTAVGPGGQTTASITVPVEAIAPPLTQEEILCANPRTYVKMEYRYLDPLSEWIDNPLSYCRQDDLLTFFLNHDCMIDYGENLCSGQTQTTYHFSWTLENGHIFNYDIQYLSADTLIWNYKSIEILPDGVSTVDVEIRETYVFLP